MSPSFPTTARAARQWLAAALTLAVCLTATAARCDPGPGPVRPAAAALAGPAWHWLQLLFPGLGTWRPGSVEKRQAPSPAASPSDGGVGTPPSCPPNSLGCQSGGSTDPNGG